MVEPIETLLARSEIADCLARYARGVDRRDWAMVRDCFHPGARDHHGPFQGDRDAFVDWVSARHAEVPFSMHYLLNCLVELDAPDTARVETYFWAIQRREGDGAATDHEVFGRYLDRFERREGRWRIADRRVSYDSTRQSPSTHHLREMTGLLGRRDGDDPVYATAKAAE